MFRTVVISILLLSLLVGVTRAQTSLEDYIDQLIKLGELTDNKDYREAIDVYKRLQAQPATPGWLKAASEYEMAELYGAMNEGNNAIAALGRAVQLGFDDCLTPRSAERLAGVLRDPRAAKVLAGMKISEGDFHELVWLKAEAQNAHHDARTMIIENTNRLDHGITEIPQSQLPTRPTTSAGVLYWRLQLLAVQKIQRDYVRRADLSRMKHVTTMGIISGGISTSATLESARRAQAAAESRKAAIRSRAFISITTSLERVRPCSEWNRSAG